MWSSLVTAADNLHTRLVNWAKVILPLMALGLLSTLFLFARGGSEPGEIPFARINDLAREQRINAPEFSGVATDGSIIEVTARSAQPIEGRLDSLSITEPSLTLDALDGTSLTIVAGEGVLDGRSNEARLSGLARVETTSGYLMETNGLFADLSSGRIVSDGALKILAPFGEIEAGQVEIEVTSSDEGQQMHFSNGVRMLYQIQQSAEE